MKRILATSAIALKQAILIAAIGLGGCALTPDLRVSTLDGDDASGAVKFRMPTAVLRPKPVFTFTEGVREGELQVDRVFVPYGDVYAIDGHAGFFKRTTVTATVTDERLLKTVSVETEDLMEERIKAIGGLAKTAIGFLGATGVEDKAESERLDSFPKKFVVSFERALKDGSFGNEVAPTTIEEPKGVKTLWSYALKFDEASSSAIEASKLAISEISRKGIIAHPSCRRVYLTLSFKGTATAPAKDYEFSEIVPDPTRLETLRFPAKGAATFSGCTVNITANSVVERDAISVLNELANQVQAIKKASDGAGGD